MGGKFVDTKYTKTIDSLVQATKNKINNPYYKFSDKKPTKCIYYRQNREKTTLDEASNDIYQHIGDSSSIKYNKILDFYLYGFSRIETELEVGDYGLESGEISGTAIILPNTIEPRDGDFFAISYVKEDLLFKVNSVSPDTLDDGANIFQINYKLERVNTTDSIEKQVEKTYKFIINNVGTEFSPVIEDSSYELVRQLDSLLNEMTSLYQMFFDKNVQNFVYLYNLYHMYDPYIIEFMIRNKLMEYGDRFIYVNHGTPIPATFGYEYTKTFYYILENPNELESRDIINTVTATGITDVNTLFVTRVDPYYQINYFDKSYYNARFNILPAEVIERIKNKGEYFTENNMIMYNLLLAYFKEDNNYINGNALEIIRHTDYADTKEFFYLIPMDIFIINRFIEGLMK